MEKFNLLTYNHGYIFWPFPPSPLGGGMIFVQIEKQEEFEGLHEKRKEKGEKEEERKE